MEKHCKKMIAPVIVCVCTALYFVFIVGAVFADGDSSFAVKIITAAVAAALIGVCVFVLIERIKEIRSGEEDDLGKY